MPKVQPESNVKMTVQGNKLIIEVELVDVETHLSGSGKSNIIATTSGNRPVPGRSGLKIGLNIYSSAKSEE